MTEGTIIPMTTEHTDAVLAICQTGLDTGNASFETTAPDWATWDETHLPDHRCVATDSAGAVIGRVTAVPVSELMNSSPSTSMAS